MLHLTVILIFLFRRCKSKDYYVHVNGTGTACSLSSPCQLSSALSQLSGKAVDNAILFNPGDYDVTTLPSVNIKQNFEIRLVNVADASGIGDYGIQTAIFCRNSTALEKEPLFILNSDEDDVVVSISGISIQNMWRSLLGVDSPATVDFTLKDCRLEWNVISVFSPTDFFNFRSVEITGSDFVHNRHAVVINNNHVLESFEISNSRFINNTHSAVFLYTKQRIQNATFANSQFIGNENHEGDTLWGRREGEKKTYGGALFIRVELMEAETNSNTSLVAKLSDCDFIDNYAAKGAGAFFMNEKGNTTLSLTRCNFIGNKAKYLGAGLYGHSPHDGLLLNVTECSFEENESWENGAGLFFFYTLGNIGVNVIDSKFNGNYAYKDGGAIYALVSSGNIDLQARNCTFDRNTGNERGGAIYLESASRNVSFYAMELNFYRNNAFFGGAVCVQSSRYDSEIVGSEFRNNVAFLGGAVFHYGTWVQLRTEMTVFESNRAEDNGGALFLSGRYVGHEAISTSFERNSATNNGGSSFVYVIDSFEMIMVNCNCTSSTAVNGGCIQVLTSGGVVESAVSLQMVVNRTNFEKNGISSSRGGKGGVVAIIPWKDLLNMMPSAAQTSGWMFQHYSQSRGAWDEHIEASKMRRSDTNEISSSVLFSENSFHGNAGDQGHTLFIETSEKNSITVELARNTFIANRGASVNVMLKVSHAIVHGNLWENNIDFAGENGGATAIFFTGLREDGTIAIQNETCVDQDSLQAIYSFLGVFFSILLDDVNFDGNKNGVLFLDVIKVQNMVIQNVTVSNHLSTNHGIINIVRTSMVHDIRMSYLHFGNVQAKSCPVIHITTAESVSLSHVSARNEEIEEISWFEFSRTDQQPVDECKVSVYNSLFEGNVIFHFHNIFSVSVESSQFKFGSGLRVLSPDASVVISNSQILSGFGIMLDYFRSFSGSGVTIYNNTKERGGGIYAKFAEYTEHFELSGKTSIMKNSAISGGAIYLEGNNTNAKVLIRDKLDIVVSQNTADFGSAFYIDLPILNFYVQAVVADNYANVFGDVYFVGQDYGGRHIDYTKVFDKTTIASTQFGMSPVTFSVPKGRFSHICKFDYLNITHFKCNINAIEMYDLNHDGVNKVPDGVYFDINGIKVKPIASENDRSVLEYSRGFNNVGEIPKIPEKSELHLYGFGDTLLAMQDIHVDYKRCVIYSENLRCTQGIWIPIIVCLGISLFIALAVGTLSMIGFCVFYCTTGKFLHEYSEYVYQPALRRVKPPFNELLTMRLLALLFCCNNMNCFIPTLTRADRDDLDDRVPFLRRRQKKRNSTTPITFSFKKRKEHDSYGSEASSVDVQENEVDLAVSLKNINTDIIEIEDKK